MPFTCLLLNDVQPDLAAAFGWVLTDTTTSRPSRVAFHELALQIEAFIPEDAAKTLCPPPGASSSIGFKDGTGDPGGCTRDMVNRFYQAQYQLNDGMLNHYRL